MSQYTHEGIRNLSPVSSIFLALLFFYFYNTLSARELEQSQSQKAQIHGTQTSDDITKS